MLPVGKKPPQGCAVGGYQLDPGKTMQGLDPQFNLLGSDADHAQFTCINYVTAEVCTSWTEVLWLPVALKRKKYFLPESSALCEPAQSGMAVMY